MSKTSLQKFRSIGKTITLATWFILIYAMILITLLLFFTIKSGKVNEHETVALASIDVYQKSIYEVVNGIYEIIDRDQEASNSLSHTVKIDIKEFKKNLAFLSANFSSVSEDNGVDVDSLSYVLFEIQKYHSNVEGIGILAMDNNGGLIENQGIFKSQLRNSIRGLTAALTKLSTISSERMEQANLIIYWITCFQILSFVLLAVYGYFRVMTPFKTIFREVRRLSQGFKEESDECRSRMDLAINNYEDREVKYKVKQAEVLKLQSSLEESIQQISRLSNERSFIYLNTATDLEGYLKVIKLQKEILENQTNIGQNDSWKTLNGAISQLNSLVGDNFKWSKQSIHSRSDSEVYLSQLISEIILSSSSKDEIKFEQVADMPSVKTNVSLLKGALRPYFEMISKYENSERINVSAFESGSVCEFKFVGLTNNLIEKLEEISNKDSLNLGFKEFKIFMAKKSILSRGGKVWGQQDVANKGVFCIRWVL